MALTRIGNTIYTTANDELVGKFVLLGVVAASTGANASVVLHDESGGTPSTPKLPIRIAAADTTQHVDLSQSPIRFETAIQVAGITNMALTLIIKEVGR